MPKPAVATKAMIIGLDAPIVPRLYDYAMNGDLPTIKSLIDRGVFGKNCLTPFPTITPPNWTTIVTGAWAGTHGITCFNVHVPGTPLDETHPGFDTADCEAEYLWNAIAKAGKRSILFNYPSSWPPKLDNGVQIGGFGLNPNEWRHGDLPMRCDICDDQVFTAEDYPEGTTLDFDDPSDWSGAPDGRALEAEMPLKYRRARLPVEPVTWHMLLVDSAGQGYDTVIVSESKDASNALATLKQGEWSDILDREFQVEGAPQRVRFRMKLVELTPDADQLRLYVTALGALDGWAYPEEAAEKIHSDEGIPLPRPGFHALLMEWIDPETWLELIEMAHTWMADATTSLLATEDWNLYATHIHTPDHWYHTYPREVDPATAESQEQAKYLQDIERQFYQSIDRTLARIFAYADDETLIVMTSDHGAKVTLQPFPVDEVLQDAGLLVYKPAVEGEPRQVDWSKTRAIQQRSCYVYVNLKGRDPDGIVEPGEEYDAVCDQIIDALTAYRDPEIDKPAVALALRRRDARIIGLYGDKVGDIVYAVNADFGGQHGPQLPTARWGIGSLEGLFIMAGPNVKQGCLLERTVNLPDLVPTICHICNWPVPEQAEGGVIYQALEDPNALLKDRDKLARNYERLKRAYESDRALTHTYNE
jgi:predicted AlkP superfamily phosphohydrolase/phosphomutase